MSGSCAWQSDARPKMKTSCSSKANSCPRMGPSATFRMTLAANSTRFLGTHHYPCCDQMLPSLVPGGATLLNQKSRTSNTVVQDPLNHPEPQELDLVERAVRLGQGRARAITLLQSARRRQAPWRPRGPPSTGKVALCRSGSCHFALSNLLRQPVQNLLQVSTPSSRDFRPQDLNRLACLL